MKTSIAVLFALGLLGADARRHKHHQKHVKDLSTQVLQQEIEQLKENYMALEHKYQQLSKITRSFAQQSPYGLAGPGGPALPSPAPFVRGEKQWMDNAQNISDYADDQTDKANSRGPYQSTAQTQGPAPFGLAADKEGKPIPGAPSLPSPQPFVRGEKQWMDNAQNIGDWGENQMTVANTRIPYMSTAQLEGVAPFGNAGPNHMGPALPSPQPFVRGEKQWMDNAQNIGDWGENQMDIANARIPYASTLQTEAEGPYGNAGAAGKGPTLPSPQPFVRGEKQWMDNAQNIGDWGENQMTVANTRIPYASTLLQTEEKSQGPSNWGLGGVTYGPAYPSPQPFVRGEKQWMDNAQNIEDWGLHQVDMANNRWPYWSTLVQTKDEEPPKESLVQTVPQGPSLYGLAGGPYGPAYPSPQPFVRGEKQWMDNAQNIEDWGLHQVDMANNRWPYWSTLVQTKDEEDGENSEYEKDTDMSILYEKDEPVTAPEKVGPNVPSSLQFIQTKDDDPKKMEGMMMEDPNIPLNLRLVHIATEEGDELIRIQE